MQQWKRLTFYIVLNILVSACTTFSVLYFWDRTQGSLPGGLIVFGEAPTGTPDPAATEVAEAPPAPTSTPVFIAYQVQNGDTFDSIALAYGVTVEELMAENGFTSEILGAGEVIRVPIHPPSAEQEGEIVIDRVAGVGDLESERVLLKHQGEGEIVLVGWQIDDEDGNVFIFPQFPQLTLFKEGAVNIYTKPGANTVIDLFWGLNAPVWEPGETVTVRDASGEVRAEYTIP